MIAGWRRQVMRDSRRLQMLIAWRPAREGEPQAEDAAPRWFIYKLLLTNTSRLSRLLDAGVAAGMPEDRVPRGARSTLDRANSRAQAMSWEVMSDFDRGLVDSSDFWRFRRPNTDHRGYELVVSVLHALFDLEDAGDIEHAGQRDNFVPYQTERPPAWQHWWDDLAIEEQRLLASRLRTYRRTRMLFGITPDRPHLAQLTLDITQEMRTAMKDALRQIEKIFEGGDVDGHVADDACTIAGGLLDRAIELGFEGLVELLTDEVDVARAVGGPAFNVVPSIGSSACQRVVVAVSQGRRGKRGLDNALRALRTHLIRCRKSLAAIVVTDTWEDALFAKEHADDWRAFQQHGVRFVVLVGGASTVGLSPLAIRL